MEFEINDRITLLRKSLGLSQTAFGEKLGVSRGVIKNIDEHNTVPKPEFLTLVYRIYGADYDWLMIGEGEMFLPKSNNDTITEFLADVLGDEETAFRRRFIEMLAGLDPTGWLLLEKTLDSLYPQKSAKKKQEP